MDGRERYCATCGAACAESDPACQACGASLKITRPLDQQALIASPALQLDVHLQTLQLFNNRYRVIRQVGAGGFGAVYEALDTWESRKVAIKEIGLAGLSAQQIIEATGSFNREVQMLSSLRHEGIPRFYEQSTDADHWYLVMQFIEGQTLEKLQEKASGGRLPLEQILNIGLQICVVLEYLHRQRPAVIFRDLKPANIMLTPGGSLYLIDFGVARRYQRERTRDTIAFGSPGYAAPEQYGRAQSTPLSDIYALGALLHCLASGEDPTEHPFKFASLRGLNIEGTRELDRLIQRMVASDPAQRPQKVRAELLMIQRLHEQSKHRTPLWIPPQGQTPPPVVLPTAGRQAQTGSMPQSQRPARKTTRRRVLAGSFIAGGGLLAIGLTAWVTTLDRSPQIIATNVNGAAPTFDASTPTDATTPADVSTPVPQSPEATPVSSSKGSVLPTSGNTYSVTYWSADMHYAAVFGNVQQQLDVYTIKQQTLLYSIPLGDNFFSTTGDAVIWSPDNSRFFLMSDAVETFVWDVQLRKLKYQFSQIAGLVAWSPDGQFLAIGGATVSDQMQVTLFLLRAADGKQLFHTYFADSNALNYLAWSPDSRYLVFPTSSTSNWQSGQRWSMTLWDSWNWRKVGEIGGFFPDSQGATFYYTASSLAWSPDGKTIAVAINNDVWLISLAYGSAGPRQKGSVILSGVAVNNSAGSTVNTLTWAPNSRYLAISQNASNGGLFICDTVRRKNVLTGHNSSGGSFVALSWAADSKSLTTADDENILSTWQL